MINNYKISLKLRNTYLTNGIINFLKGFPLIGKSIHDSIYGDKEIKNIFYVISLIIKVIFEFIKKTAYILLFVFIELLLYKDKTNTLLNIFFFLSLVGGILNTGMFNPSKDKYYAIVLMKFDAKKYTLSNYFIPLLLNSIPFILLFTIISIAFNINIFLCLSLIFLPIMIKNITNTISLIKYDKTGKIYNENKPGILTYAIGILLAALGYILPYYNISINTPIYLVIFALLLISNIYVIKYMINYKKYFKIYKKLLQETEFSYEETNKNVDKENYEKIIVNENVESDKQGYAYLNDLFIKKHKKILSRPSKIVSIISFIILLILIVAFSIIGKDKDINDTLNNSLPLYLILMYYINRGQYITKCMFMNCDHSMLTYRTFRKPASILLLFKERLLTLIKLNIVPGIIIATGSTILLYLTGGTNVINYPIFFFAIISMSIFFSIHYLVMYYLLQPYNIDLDIKNPIYNIVVGGTYFVCYETMSLKLPTFQFGLFVIIFTIIYSIVSLKIAYERAPKTFKLRD